MNMFSGLKGEGLAKECQLDRLRGKSCNLFYFDRERNTYIMRSGPKQILSHFLQQREFMVAMGKRVAVIPGDALLADVGLAVKLIEEEVNEELLPAVKQLANLMDGDHERMLLTAVLDGAVDAVYVIYQLCNTLGLPFDEAFAEVHRSNMAKKSPDGTVHYREDGKVLKPPGWTPPDLRSIIGKAMGENWWPSVSTSLT